MPNTVNFEDTPGLDLDFDNVFGNPEVETPVTPTEASTPQVVEPFLKTATGTVYKSAEDAVTGIEHKDALITQLRQELATKTGVDPLKKTQPAEEQGPTNYFQNNDSYFTDLSKAVESKDQKRYLEIQRQLVYDSIAPLTPLLANLVKEQAAAAVETQVTGFRDFSRSEAYTKTLESFPLLKQAIQTAESNPETAQQLPEFYKMAYYASRGIDLPGIVQASANRSVEPVRPTVSSSSVAPPSNQQRAAVPSLNTPEGRKAIIEQQERLGVDNLRM